MIYPPHVQAFINAYPLVPGLDRQALVERYYQRLERKGIPDTSAEFFKYTDGYLDGHVGGFEDGVKYAKP